MPRADGRPARRQHRVAGGHRRSAPCHHPRRLRAHAGPREDRGALGTALHGRYQLRLPSGWRRVPADGGQRRHGRSQPVRARSPDPGGSGNGRRARGAPASAGAHPRRPGRPGIQLARGPANVRIPDHPGPAHHHGRGRHRRGRPRAEPRPPVRRRGDRDDLRVRRADRRRRAPGASDGREARGGRARGCRQPRAPDDGPLLVRPPGPARHGACQRGGALPRRHREHRPPRSGARMSTESQPSSGSSLAIGRPKRRSTTLPTADP